MLPTARSFPDAVPILIDAKAGVTLRAASARDLPAMVEQCRDHQMIRWTTVPTPDGGYHTPRRPIADHSSPPDDLKTQIIESVSADQLQGSFHD
jgi:hypothetical protein